MPALIEPTVLVAWRSPARPMTRGSGRRAVEIALREDERIELETVVRAGSSAQSLAKRARVVLLAAEG